ncbi:hypothetical protein ABZZ47_31655 [Streptomyces sp. NPDC006465]|uniref:hypothetical protein n=1 Tax=Streptomyces sp. NPDC006465 TaxID=3157174 RepID=UPI0033A84F2F
MRAVSLNSLVSRDGAKGHPGNAPCDHIISTVGLHAIPKPLLEQAALGAVIVAPIGYGIARVTVTAPGHATGRFLTVPAYFMGRRTGGSGPQFDAALEQSPTDTSSRRRTCWGGSSSPHPWPCPATRPAAGGRRTEISMQSGLWTPDGSTAIAHTSGSVRQIGPQKLRDTVEDLAKFFGDEPERDAFLLAVTPTRQTVFYEDTDGPSWALPATF